MTPNGSLLLLLVDDEPAQLRLVSAIAQRGGWRTVAAASGDMALARLASRDGAQLDAILIDGSNGDATPLIQALRAKRPDVPIVALAANEDIATAVSAMRAGASDFLVKPVSPQRLLAALAAAVETGAAGGELRPLAEKLTVPLAFEQMVGAAPRFVSAINVAARAADARVPMLIDGERGVGKDMLAEAVHRASDRRDKPLVKVECAGLAASALESQLFGHEAGAFPGAFSRATGKLVEADGGTLLLDEVDQLPPELQQKLLTFLDTGLVAPIGGHARAVDVRLLAASNGSLLAAAESGKFREDLYYRLATVHVTLPPLRERRADVPVLARHMLERIGRKPGLRQLDIDDDALGLLAAFDWPGNARQLYDVLFRAAVLCDDGVLVADCFPHILGRSAKAGEVERIRPQPPVALFDGDGHLRSMDAIEADIIRFAISHYRGRMTEVARRLGIGRSTLYRKIAELGISDAA